jgi:hypothetical protein
MRRFPWYPFLMMLVFSSPSRAFQLPAGVPLIR